MVEYCGTLARWVIEVVARGPKNYPLTPPGRMHQRLPNAWCVLMLLMMSPR